MKRVLTIETMGGRGEGVAEGPVYVPFALPGETVEAEIAGGRAAAMVIITASPERIAPVCRHFGACGGCQVQHWDLAAYRAWKRQLVVTALRHRGIAADVLPLIDGHGQGRRRIVLHVRRRSGVVTAGFMAQRSHDLIDIVECPVLDPALACAAAIARDVGAAAGDCDCAFTVTDFGLDLAIKAERALQPSLMRALAPVARDRDLVRLTLNGETVFARGPAQIAIGTAMVSLPAVSFLQATAAGEAVLAGFVLEHLRGARLVADLFCGAGPFALRLAERARVYGADSDKPSIAALAAAARATPGLKPVEAVQRDLFREPLTAMELARFDAVVFDPPRAGAEAQMRQIAKSKLGLVVAVSCDPASFARDAAILVAAGFVLKLVQPVDQFRYTPHVEIAALFGRR